jgi:hypothetical protein
MRREGEEVHTPCTRTAVARDSRNFVRLGMRFPRFQVRSPLFHMSVCVLLYMKLLDKLTD